MFYIVGLGNPGADYTNTRHNVGRLVLDAVRVCEHFPDWEHSKHANALCTEGVLGGEQVELLLPETFMNNSGQSVSYAVRKHGAKPEDVIVLYDDVDLALGELKVSKGRGSGGHNGVESIVNALGSKDFVRVRIGISPKSFWTGKTKRPTGEQMAKYVLGRFSKGELEKVAEVGERAAGALQTIITDGPEQAMNRFN